MSMFRPYEEIFHYHREGLVDEWLWESTSAPCVAVMGTPGFDDWWKARSDWFSADFKEHVATESGGGAWVSEARLALPAGPSNKELLLSALP